MSEHPYVRYPGPCPVSELDSHDLAAALQAWRMACAVRYQLTRSETWAQYSRHLRIAFG